MKKNKSNIIVDTGKKRDDVRIIVAPRRTLTYILILNPHNNTNKKITIRLGAFSSLYIGGIVLGKQRERCAVTITIEHKHSHSHSKIILRGVATGAAHINFTGNVLIQKNIQGASTTLDERILLVTRKASATVIPNLEICAHEVQATHAATISKISENSIFYLQSRGIGKKEASKLMISSFLREPLQPLLANQFRASLEKVINQKVSQCFKKARF